MANEDQIIDSPSAWGRKHIHRYAATDGRQGHKRKPSFPALLLTTKGRQPGQLRRTALIYGQDGDNYLVVASKGGHPHHPNWYLNLTDNPEVEVQVGADKFTARARTASPDEKARLWPMMAKI